MNPIMELAHKVRDRVNHPWKRELIFSDRVRWDKVCSCMDVLEDTQLAIDHFFKLPAFSGNDGGYLYLYGLLQACFLQQDATNNLSQALFGKSVDWENEPEKIYRN